MIEIFPARLQVNNRIYSDISFKWKMEPDDSVTDLHSLRQKILFILATYIGSRKWRETFGSHVEKYLFEPFDDTTAGWIKSSIAQAIKEPANGIHQDVVVVKIQVIPDSSTRTYWTQIVWRAPKLEGASTRNDTISFNMRHLG